MEQAVPSDLEAFSAYLDVFEAIWSMVENAAETDKSIHLDTKLTKQYDDLSKQLEKQRGAAHSAAVRSGNWSHNDIDREFAYCKERFARHLTVDKSMSPKEALQDFHNQLSQTRGKFQCTLPLLDDKPRTSQPATEKAVAREYFITLDQAAALVNRKKRTLERYKKDKKQKMPKPRVSGGGGKPAEWAWSELKPWLEEHFNRLLPDIPPHHVGQ
jgi:hypothetical protein